METLSPQHYEEDQDHELSPAQIAMQPIVDTLRTPQETAEFFPDLAETLIPQVERHQQLANQVNAYLDNFYQPESLALNTEINPETYHNYLSATSEILQNPETERLALYLPFESLPNPDDHSEAAQNFRQSYLAAWQNLLFVKDIRENFNRGDIIEPEAQNEPPAYAIKAAHLAPWLVQKQMISVQNILDMLEIDDDVTFRQSFCDTLPMLEDYNLLSGSEKQRFLNIQAQLPPQHDPLPPKFISAHRQAWLDQLQSATPRPTTFTTAMQDLAQPISERLPNLQTEINLAEELAQNLDPEQTTGIVILSGSRLKGYGRDDSDLDLTILTTNPNLQLDNVNILTPDQIVKTPPTYAHEVFDFVWLGDTEKVNYWRKNLAELYFREENLPTRSQATERLELDLINYRLLHKGYAALCPDTNPEYKKYTTIDGDSAFYETGFRRIATKIYANSVFIPQVK